MNSKTRKNAMREAFRLLSERTDPHGFPIKSEDILKSIVITNEGDISLKIRPKIPHCPCCLYDLSLLKEEFLSNDAIKSIDIIVVEIPGAEDWNNALSSRRGYF